MPEHVHLLLSEPPHSKLADAIHYLKLSFAKRLRSRYPEHPGTFWQKRYYDRNVRDYREFTVKLRYIQSPEEWHWSSYRSCAGVDFAPPFLATDELLRLFGRTPGRARAVYRKFVADAPEEALSPKRAAAAHFGPVLVPGTVTRP